MRSSGRRLSSCRLQSREAGIQPYCEQAARRPRAAADREREVATPARKPDRSISIQFGYSGRFRHGRRFLRNRALRMEGTREPVA
jgi:hypothetical protein